MKLRCAVLDDYQSVAATAADWSPVADDIDVEIGRAHSELQSRSTISYAVFCLKKKNK